ncbi:MAG: hypothetical protein WCK34_12825 [Bacteroidota bacterium]
MVNNKSTNFFIIFTLAVYLLLQMPHVFQEGLFMDGLIYSTVGNNLSRGEGTFWFPEFSETVMKDFHEHPPLQFGIESVIFKAFGNGFYIEKIYSAVMGLITALVIILIWRSTWKKSPFSQLYWLPVLFWITIPRVFWSYNNNMLENTMGFFSISALYLLMLSTGKPLRQRLLFFTATGLLLCLSFLSKGFPGLYPLGFFFCHYLAYGKSSGRGSMVANTILLIVATFTIATIYLVFNRPAVDSLSQYLHTQVLTSIEGRGRIDSRIALPYDLLQQLLLLLAACTVIILSGLKKFISGIRQERDTIRLFILFLFIGLSASLPLMISPKQAAYYLVPALPFFAIGFSMLVAAPVAGYLSMINPRAMTFRILTYGNYLLVVSAILYSVANFGTICKDKELITDVNSIGRLLPAGSTISVLPSMYQEWSLMGYLQRKYEINIDRSRKLDEYLLIERESPVAEGYDDTFLPLLKFKLLRKHPVI